MLALESRKLPTTLWETVLPDALHSIWTLLCASTNATPHERLFTYPRRSSCGLSISTWLTTPGNVLLRKHNRKKEDPWVEEVQLIDVNPHYAHIRFPNGREDTVSDGDLAPCGDSAPVFTGDKVQNAVNDEISLGGDSEHPQTDENLMDVEHLPDSSLRRSTRIKKPVYLLNYSSFS
ncbi:UNVERIFIED_CONTAM: hypothetical protein RMT77_015362 [Armadillidium vulgare]